MLKYKFFFFFWSLKLSLCLIDSGLNVLRDGHAVSRRSDFIIYSVEAKNIDKVVAEYGPCK